MSTTFPPGYPNQHIGIQPVTSIHSGTVNKFTAPIKLDTGDASGTNVLGAMIQSGSGVPTVGSPLGGFYLRTDTPSTTNQRIYICTVAGVAGAATWVGIL